MPDDIRSRTRDLFDDREICLHWITVAGTIP